LPEDDEARSGDVGITVPVPRILRAEKAVAHRRWSKLVLVGLFLVIAVDWILSPSSRGTSSFRVISKDEKAIVPPLLAGPWREGRDESVAKVQSLNGATKAQVLAQLGEPNVTWESPVNQAAGEFRIELRNTYPFEDPRSKRVRILEWQWWYREFRFAVWFHKVEGEWVVLDTCRWRNSVRF
jgi:hypothetical protein